MIKFSEMELKYRFNSPSVGLKMQSFDSTEMEIISQKKIQCFKLNNPQHEKYIGPLKGNESVASEQK